MTHAASVTYLGSEFNDFLYAPIGPDRNGMLLSVLSALARQNVDPWEEAAALARLHVRAATDRLIALISAIPDGPSARPDPAAIAARLVALLPSPTAPVRPPALLSDVSALTHARAGIVPYVMLLIFLLVGQLVAGLQLAAQVDHMHAPAATAASAQTPVPGSGK
jgi:hypothetical protein